MKRFLVGLFALFALIFGVSTPSFAQSNFGVRFADRDAIPSYGSASGTWFYADDVGPSQFLLLGHNDAGVARAPRWSAFAALSKSESITISVDFAEPAATAATFKIVSCDGDATVAVGSDELAAASGTVLRIPVVDGKAVATLSAQSESAVLELGGFDVVSTVPASDANAAPTETSAPLAIHPVRRSFPTDSEYATFPDFQPALADALVRWDWKMQDGIETPREPRTWLQATEKTMRNGRALLADLVEHNLTSEDAAVDLQKRWDELERKLAEIQAQNIYWQNGPATEELWLAAHILKREILLSCDYLTDAPILFAKHVPSAMSHQLTQVYGYCARPGGGIFTLPEPGKSMRTERLAKDLPTGNYMHPTASADGETIYFAFCEVSESPKSWPDLNVLDRVYQIYRTNRDGSGLTRLTNDEFDNFSPLPLPDGDVVFCSTRRGGYHRCGKGPCFVYALSRMKGDGSDPRLISFHETQEWNPTLTNDGRILYTRWDYVDRNAVHYQNLWSARQDGTDVRIYFGNNSVFTAGIWEPKAIPDSTRIMAIAGPHHGVSAGSVILVDPSKGVDGIDSITRVTPEVLFPEGEDPMPSAPLFPATTEFDSPIAGAWKSEWNPVPQVYPEEQRRWPGHHFKTPYPFSEKYFLASYSFDRLVGEAGPNIPNQYGVYMADAFGNRELLYRDPNMSSVWAAPLEARPEAPSYASALPDRATAPDSGTFFVQNVYESWPYEIPGKVAALRIVEVLLKSTPDANNPMVGAANASPGKRTLGTVPVEEDGSAWFEVPAETPVMFQALDENGRMIQGMRSLVYLQKGENASCTGCHENRLETVPTAQTIASRREKPSQIEPGPDGSNPHSFPIMVQPILDRLCVSCHNAEKAEGNIDLTGAPDGAFSKSYNALIPYVSFSSWGAPNGNYEPRTEPDRFGARASRLTQILDAGHYDCELTEDDWERLSTWMDVNALFYGTFNPEQQARQRVGERLEPSEVE